MGRDRDDWKTDVLVITVVLTLCFLINTAAPTAALQGSSNNTENGSTVQYSHARQFQAGTVFDYQSSFISVNPSVQDSTPPRVILTLSGVSVEGSVTKFKLTTEGFIHIVSWNWSYDDNRTWQLFDDGLTGTYHTFTNNGSYWVSVNATERDGAWSLSNLLVNVQGIPPDILRFWSPEGITYDMDQNVSFWVWAIPTYKPITEYEWNFNYNPSGAGGAWIPSSPFLTNHTTWSFNRPGTHYVEVKVWTQDGFVLFPSWLEIQVNDVVPVASFSYHNSTQTSGQVLFDATLSTDTPSDIASLNFSWNFGDSSGWTPFSTEAKTISHEFADGRYTVTLIVRDQWGLDSIPVHVNILVNVSPQGLSVEDLTLLVVILTIAIAVLILLIRNAMVTVDDVFIIYNDGRLMAHQTRRLKPGMDDEILGSMLTAIQCFVKDSFKDESSTNLQRLDFGEEKILVERGDSFYLAVVLHSHRAGNVPHRMQGVIADIHREYGQALKEWDGDLEKVRGVKNHTDKLFRSPIPLTLPGLNK